MWEWSGRADADAGADVGGVPKLILNNFISNSLVSWPWVEVRVVPSRVPYFLCPSSGEPHLHSKCLHGYAPALKAIVLTP